jgi:hypothetical protein
MDRILQLYAEENAIEDTVYYLGEALRKGVIELETFLKVSTVEPRTVALHHSSLPSNSVREGVISETVYGQSHHNEGSFHSWSCCSRTACLATINYTHSYNQITVFCMCTIV